MPDAIPGMKGKGKGDRHLGGQLRSERPAGEACRQGGSVEMPAEQGRDEVGGAEDVEAAGEDGAGNAVQPGQEPGYLRTVDLQVGGDGAVEALRGEDRVRVGGAGGLGCGLSGRRGEFGGY